MFIYLFVCVRQRSAMAVQQSCSRRKRYVNAEKSNIPCRPEQKSFQRAHECRSKTQRFEVCWKTIPRMWSSDGKRPLPELEPIPRYDKVPLHSVTKRWPRWNIGDGSHEVFHIHWRLTDDRLVDKQAQLVLDSSSNRQPMELPECRRSGRVVVGRSLCNRAATWRTRCNGAIAEVAGKSIVPIKVDQSTYSC